MIEHVLVAVWSLNTSLMGSEPKIPKNLKLQELPLLGCMKVAVGAVHKWHHHRRGWGRGGGVTIPPKNDDVIYEQPLTWVALWCHLDRLHHGAHCCPIGWFSIWVVCGIIIRPFSNGFTAIGCFAVLSVLSEFLHVVHFTFSQSRKKLFWFS